MAARVANLKSCHYQIVGDFVRAMQLLNEAIQIRESFPKEEQDPFLVANLYNRKAGFLLKERRLDEADFSIDVAIAYSAALRGRRHPETDKLVDLTYDHQYFGLYDHKKAQIKLAKEELEEAMKFINRALETFRHHEQDSKALIEEANRTKIEIETVTWINRFAAVRGNADPTTETVFQQALTMKVKILADVGK